MIQGYTGGSTLIDGNKILTDSIQARSLAVDSVAARNIQAGAVQATHLAVGPQYQFRATAGGKQMTLAADGSLSLPTTSLNPNDGTWVADSTRSYTASQLVKTFGISVSNPSSLGYGIGFNLSNPFATTGLTGIRVYATNTNVIVQRMTGVGVYVTLGTYPRTGTTLERMLIQYYGAQASPRMRMYIDGVEFAPGIFTDTFLGTSGGVKGGSCGLFLADSSILVRDIVCGSQPTIVEDGTISTQHLQTSTIFTNQIVVNNLINGINAGATTIDGNKLTVGTVAADSLQVGAISAGGITANMLEAVMTFTSSLRSSGATAWQAGSAGNAPVGFRLDGTPFTTTFMDGSTQAVNLELGAGVNIAGRPALSIANRALGGFIEYAVPGEYTWVCPEGVTHADIEVCGGGGGGAAGYQNSRGGGGGAAGSAASCALVEVVPGRSYRVTVGAGGEGGYNSNQAGWSGFPSTVDYWVGGPLEWRVILTAVGGEGGHIGGVGGGAAGGAAGSGAGGNGFMVVSFRGFVNTNKVDATLGAASGGGGATVVNTLGGIGGNPTIATTTVQYGCYNLTKDAGVDTGVKGGGYGGTSIFTIGCPGAGSISITSNPWGGLGLDDYFGSQRSYTCGAGGGGGSASATGFSGGWEGAPGYVSIKW